MSSTNLLKDSGVLGIDRLRPDLGHTELYEAEDRQHAGLDIGADTYNRTVELIGADLAERLGVCRVGGHNMGEIAGEALDDVDVFIDGQHFVPQAHE